VVSTAARQHQVAILAADVEDWSRRREDVNTGAGLFVRHKARLELAPRTAPHRHASALDGRAVTLPHMWIDADGVAHSVALPDPSDLMSVEFRTGLDDLLTRESTAVSQIVEDEEDRFFDEDLTTLADVEKESAFEGLAPPRSVLDGHVGAPDDVRTAIANADWRWRLDVICALDDYIE
jgi:hypothetical protein